MCFTYISSDHFYYVAVNFLDCVKSEFKKYYNRKRHLYPNCTTPWTQCMLGNKGFVESAPCSFSQMKEEQNLNVEFNALVFNKELQNCPGKIILNVNSFFLI